MDWQLVAVGIVLGFVIGLTGMGGGAARLVGTDLVQAVPLVGSAALGHLLFGDVHFDLTASILIGALPAVFLGARLSSTARFGMIRPALLVVLVVLVASALALLGASDAVLWVLVASTALTVTSWLVSSMIRRRRSTARQRRRPEAALENGPHAHLREG